jgi:hypothetical protein
MAVSVGDRDDERILVELDAFIALTELRSRQVQRGTFEWSTVYDTAAGDEEIARAAHVVEQLVDRIIPEWRTSVSDEFNANVNRWYQLREAAGRARTALLRDADVAEMLGDGVPRLAASHLHPWVWGGAQSLWVSGHFREAVVAAALAVNARTQIKVERPDVSETDLFHQAFSLDAPKPGAARLRLMPNDGGKTYKSVHRGVMAFAEGWFAAVRNPHSHTVGQLTDDAALEQLAALSMLARWVDGASVEAVA